MKKEQIEQILDCIKPECADQFVSVMTDMMGEKGREFLLTVVEINEASGIELRASKVINMAAVAFSSRQYEVKPEDILGRSRKREIVEARHATMYTLLKFGLFRTYQSCAAYLNRDHATAMNSKKQHQNFIETDYSYRLNYDKMMSLIQ